MSINSCCGNISNFSLFTLQWNNRPFIFNIAETTSIAEHAKLIEAAGIANPTNYGVYTHNGVLRTTLAETYGMDYDPILHKPIKSQNTGILDFEARQIKQARKILGGLHPTQNKLTKALAFVQNAGQVLSPDTGRV